MYVMRCARNHLLRTREEARRTAPGALSSLTRQSSLACKPSVLKLTFLMSVLCVGPVSPCPGPFCWCNHLPPAEAGVAAHGIQIILLWVVLFEQSYNHIEQHRAATHAYAWEPLRGRRRSGSGGTRGECGKKVKGRMLGLF